MNEFYFDKTIPIINRLLLISFFTFVCKIHRKSPRTPWKTFAQPFARKLQHTRTTGVQRIRCIDSSIWTHAPTDYRRGKTNVLHKKNYLFNFTILSYSPHITRMINIYFQHLFNFRMKKIKFSRQTHGWIWYVHFIFV